MADSGTRALGGGRYRIAAEVVGGGFNHPKITLDGGTVYQTAHDVDGAIFGGERVGSGAVTRKRVVRGDGKVQVSLRPGIRRGILVRSHT